MIEKRDSVAWPSSAATSPGLRPLPRSQASSIFRQHSPSPSPDPWAVERSSHDRKRAPSTTSLNALGITGLDSRRESTEIRLSSALEEEVAEIPEVKADDTRLEDNVEIIVGNESQVWELPPPRDSNESHDSDADADADAAPKVEIHDAVSRPSSACSLNSSYGADRQDSPITSIDEDPKSRLQATSRKVSGKVQELVERFDHLAKVATVEPPAPPRLESSLSGKGSRSRSLSQARSAGAEEDGDFGDFEDAKSEYGKVELKLNASTTSSRRSSTPKARLKDSFAQGQTGEPAERQVATPRTASIPVQQLVEKFGSIRFDIDFQSIDKLFPDLPQDAGGDTGETSEVTDKIIDDSFTGISERKTWYRISRFGSMRKHDMGDEDNYYRVQWSTSHLHSDTIKIVRRWMEEDSISGRVTLGAGKRTSVFNWDSSAAAPVDLGKVFSRKASAAHSRNASNASIPPPNPGSRLSMQSMGSNHEGKSIKSPIKPPDASFGSVTSSLPGFGWSSNVKSTATTHPSNKQGKHQESTSLPLAPAKNEAQAQATSQPPQPVQTKATLEDDEDDWGEMVSSPRIETNPSSITAMQPLNNGNGYTPASTNLAKNTSNPEVKKAAITQSGSAIPKLSVSIPQSSKAPNPIASQATSSTKIQRTNPWPLADFSIFENLSARTPKSPRQDPWPLADFSVFESPTSGSVSSWMGSLKTKSKANPKSRDDSNIQARASTDKTAEAKTPLTAVLGPIQKPNQEQDHDDIVRNIVQNLPDLSYMLR